MTCIAGLISNGDIYIGGDSAGVSGIDLRLRKDEKVFIKNNMIFGYTSSFRMGQILRYKLTIPSYYPQIDLYEYMVDSFVDAVRKCFKDSGYMTIDKSVEEGGHFLIGFRGRLFTVNSDLQVGESVYPFSAVGCGEDYALASLATSPEAMLPRDRIHKAMEVSEQFSCGVRRPFVILKLERDTKNQTIK